MKTTLDDSGRLMVPEPLRERLRLTPGQALEITEVDGRLEVEPTTVAMRLEDTGDGVVAVPAEELPVLTDEMVRQTLERVRR